MGFRFSFPSLVAPGFEVELLISGVFCIPPVASGPEGLGALVGLRLWFEFRLDEAAAAPPGLQGVLLALITADTRSGTETAKGSEMFSAFLWCRGDKEGDSKGKKERGGAEPITAPPPEL